jgi:hypothetical protein
MSASYIQSLSLQQLLALDPNTLRSYNPALTDTQRTWLAVHQGQEADAGDPNTMAGQWATQLSQVYNSSQGFGFAQDVMTNDIGVKFKEGDENKWATKWGTKYPYRVGTQGDATSGGTAWQDCQGARAFIASNLYFYRQNATSGPWNDLQTSYRQLCEGVNADGTSSNTTLVWADADNLEIGWDKQAGYFGAVENMAIAPDDPTIENPNPNSVKDYKNAGKPNATNPYSSVSPPGSVQASGNTLKSVTGYSAIKDPHDTNTGWLLLHWKLVAAGLLAVTGIYVWWRYKHGS